MLRKLIEHAWVRKGYDHKHAYICSLSSHTIVYKGQLLPAQVPYKPSYLPFSAQPPRLTGIPALSSWHPVAQSTHPCLWWRTRRTHQAPSASLCLSRVKVWDLLFAGTHVLPGSASTRLHLLHDAGALAVLHQHLPLLGPCPAYAHDGPQW